MHPRIAILFLLVPAPVLAQARQTPVSIDTTRYERTAPELRGLRWRLVGPFRERPDTQVSTLKIRLRSDEGENPAVNKVVCAADGRALYFSKYPVPYDRDGRDVVRYKHIGLYAYRAAALDLFHRLPPSPLELTEKLEQLRFLEHGIPIVVVETDEPTIGVDTEADLRAVEARLAARRA